MAGCAPGVSALNTNCPGFLTVTSTPAGASVYIDGMYQGITPEENIQMNPGQHSIRLSLNGYFDTNEVLQFACEKKITRNYPLTPIPITTTPTPAYVTCQAPCECLSSREAAARWVSGSSQCSASPCGKTIPMGDTLPAIKYCFQPTKIQVPVPVNVQPPKQVIAAKIPAQPGAPNVVQINPDIKQAIPAKPAPGQYICTDQYKTNCDGTCIDTYSNMENCGVCGMVCPNYQSCYVGKCVGDADGDTIADVVDNCPILYNPEQIDSDHDNMGDLCDLCPKLAEIHSYSTYCIESKNVCDDYKNGTDVGYYDRDGDGIGNRCDNCPGSSNPDQKDSEWTLSCDAGGVSANQQAASSGVLVAAPKAQGQKSSVQYVKYSESSIKTALTQGCKLVPAPDGIGDACDSCPYLANPAQEDRDRDGDGIADICDPCPDIFSPDTEKTSPFSLQEKYANGDQVCLGCNEMLNPAAEDTNNNGIKDTCEPYVRLLFVPLNWKESQAKFDGIVSQQVKFYSENIPLKGCPQRIKVEILDVKTQNNDKFTCSRTGSCGVENVRDFVIGQGINIPDYDAVVGVTAETPCPNIVGCSNLADTVWITSPYEVVTAHELGHIYGLSDEYCSNPAGSTSCNCNDGDKGSLTCGDTGNDGAATGDKNWLDASLGCDPTGTPCNNWDNNHKCSVVDYNICSKGNVNSGGGRCIMTYADAEGPRSFCPHCEDWLATIPQIHCHSPPMPLNRSIIDMSVTVNPVDGVTEDKIMLTDGRPTPDLDTRGAYSIRVLKPDAGIAWQKKFDLYFDYFGPRVKDVDYSNISYDSQSVHYRIPYNDSMKTLQIYHGDKLIFSKELNFCNSNGICDSTETHQTCPKDCTLNRNDGVCTKAQDNICDPDCLPGVDPDCSSLPLLPLVFGGVLIMAAVSGWYLLRKKKLSQK